MNNLLIKKSELVEIYIAATAAGSVSLFRPSQNLIGKKIRVYGLAAYTASQIAVAPSGRTVIPNADAVNLVVNLVENANDSSIDAHPYYDLIRANVGGFVTLVEPRIFDIDKCFLQGMAAGTLATTQSALINIYYEPL